MLLDFKYSNTSWGADTSRPEPDDRMRIILPHSCRPGRDISASVQEGADFQVNKEGRCEAIRVRNESPSGFGRGSAVVPAIRAIQISQDQI